MTDQMHTEDDIARLFAEANPVPIRGSLGDSGGHPTTSGARSNVMIDLDAPAAGPANSERRHPWWLLGAAAVVLASIGAIAVIAIDEDPPTAGPDITMPDRLVPLSTRLDIVDEFFSAVDAYDAGAAARALAPGTVPALAPGAVVVNGSDPASLDAQLSWLEAFGWRWEIEACREEGDSGASCELSTHNRLTDQAGRTGLSTIARIGFDGALIEQLAITTDFDTYGLLVFTPFYDWVAEHHPDDVERLWISEGSGVRPHLTQDAAELMDRRLTEYLAISADDAKATGADVAIAEDFVQAFNERDLLALNRIAADPAALIAEIVDPSDPAIYFAWLDAFDWRWEEAECAADGDAVVCRVFIRNKLTDAIHVERPAVVTLSVADGLVHDMSVVDNFGDYSTKAFVPFVEWVAATYPGDLREMWTITYSGISPHQTEESVPLFATHLDEYSASDPLPTPAHREFLAAQTSGDVDSSTARLAPDAVVDQLWATSADDLPGLSRLLSGLGWDWNIRSCSISTHDLDPGRTRISCVADPTWRLDDRDIGVTPTIVEFEFTSAGIASVRTRSRERIAADVAPLFDWIRTTHPDDADSLLAEQDGTTVPVLSDAAVEQLLQLVDEYLSRSEG